MRIPFKITEKLLLKVRRIAARGQLSPEIARYLGIADRTLRKYQSMKGENEDCARLNKAIEEGRGYALEPLGLLLLMHWEKIENFEVDLAQIRKKYGLSATSDYQILKEELHELSSDAFEEVSAFIKRMSECMENYMAALEQNDEVKKWMSKGTVVNRYRPVPMKVDYSEEVINNLNQLKLTHESL